MKTLIILGNYPPPFGGVPRHIKNFAPYLQKNNWRIHVVSRLLSKDAEKIQSQGNLLIHKPTRIKRFILLLFNIHRLNYFPYLSMQNIIMPLRILRDFLRHNSYVLYIENYILKIETVDFISAYNLYVFGPIATQLKKKYNINFSLTNFGEVFTMDNYFKYNYSTVKWVYQRCDLPLAMSHHCAKSISTIGIKEKINVIPYGVNLEDFSLSLDSNKKNNLYSINILFVGRLEKEMGIHILLQSIPKIILAHPNAIITIVGQRGSYSNQIEEIQSKHKSNIIFLQNLPYSQLPNCYNGSTIVVVPTIGDRACGSLTAIEAMVYKKPVIGSHIGGIPEIIQDKVNGLLIPPNDSNLLINAINHLIKNPELCEQYGENGRASVINKFDNDKIFKQLEALFSESIISNI